METLKEWRKAKGITQDGLAEKLGVDKQFVSNIERGLSSMPPKHFKRIAKVLGVSVQDLLKLHLKRTEALVKKAIKYESTTSLIRQ